MSTKISSTIFIAKVVLYSLFSHGDGENNNLYKLNNKYLNYHYFDTNDFNNEDSHNFADNYFFVVYEGDEVDKKELKNKLYPAWGKGIIGIHETQKDDDDDDSGFGSLFGGGKKNKNKSSFGKRSKNNDKEDKLNTTGLDLSDVFINTPITFKYDGRNIEKKFFKYHINNEKNLLKKIKNNVLTVFNNKCKSIESIKNAYKNISEIVVSNENPELININVDFDNNFNVESLFNTSSSTDNQTDTDSSIISIGDLYNDILDHFNSIFGGVEILTSIDTNDIDERLINKDANSIHFQFDIDDSSN